LAQLLGQAMIASITGCHLPVAEHDGAQHDVLGQLLRLGFDHQHGVGGAGDDEVELRSRPSRRSAG
jgi:hypothetical protein